MVDSMPPGTRTAARVAHICRPLFNPGESIPGYLLRFAADNFFNGIAALARVHELSAHRLVSMDVQSLSLLLWGTKSDERIDLGHLQAARPVNARAYLWRSRCRFCPECWKSGASERYFRDKWDEVASMLCDEHGVVLLDSCPSCRGQLDYKTLRSPVRCTCGHMLSASVSQKPSRAAKRALQALGLSVRNADPDVQLRAAAATLNMNTQTGLAAQKETLVRPELAFLSAERLKDVESWFAEWPEGFAREFYKRGLKPRDIVGLDIKSRFRAFELPDIDHALTRILAEDSPVEGSNQGLMGLTPVPKAALFVAFPRRDNPRAALLNFEEIDGQPPRGAWPVLLLAVYGRCLRRSGQVNPLDADQVRAILIEADPETSSPVKGRLSSSTGHLLKAQQLLKTTRVLALDQLLSPPSDESASRKYGEDAQIACGAVRSTDGDLAIGITFMHWVVSTFDQDTVDVNISVIWRLTSCRLAIDCYLWLRIVAVPNSGPVTCTWGDLWAQLRSESSHQSFSAMARSAWSLVMDVCPNIIVIPVHDGFRVRLSPGFFVEGR